MALDRPKILIATFGTLGDVNPFIGLGRALQRHGCVPVIATSEEYRDLVQSEGLDFRPMRPDLGEISSRLNMQKGEIATKMSRSKRFLFDQVMFPHLRDAYRDVMELTKDVDGVVTHCLAFGAKAAAEQRNLPLFNVFLSPMLLFSADNPPLGTPAPFMTSRSPLAVGYNGLLIKTIEAALTLLASPLARFRDELGLPGVRGFELLVGAPGAAATIGLFSSLLMPPVSKPTRSEIIVGHSFHDGCNTPAGASEPGGLPSELIEFLDSGSEPIVFTLGSLVAIDRIDYFRDCAIAARSLKRRAILLADSADVNKLRQEMSSEISVHGYVPHSLLFPRCCAVVHHGGMGSVGQALRAGKPQLVTPFCNDQFDIAERLRRLGVARTLKPKDVSADQLARNMEWLLSSANYADRARAVADEIALNDGAESAAALISQRLRRRGPGISGCVVEGSLEQSASEDCGGNV
ncbi:glycosyltransferase [Methylocystis sp.]|uniref:glycosyltransferase n=1 Tax=Methylocystis sp. TaxID=1911079 RepID=UPI002734C779|nr:glycosyltransferase [Methylocystis sp.]MDP3554904.1 glycosyltransferase [Methylocystis sp.]